MIKVINWLIWSSANPSKISITIKGVGLYLVPIVIAVSGITGIATPDQEGLTAIVDSVSTIVEVMFSVIASIVTLVGLLRKILTTWKGTNAVLTAYDRGEFDY